MGPINSVKKCNVRSMNSSKNKLNSEIILIFNPNPNAHLLSISMILEIFFIIINPLDSTSYFLFFIF